MGTETDYLPVNPPADPPWDVQIVCEAYADIEECRDMLENHSVLSKEIAEQFDKLLSMLERDIDGMRAANVS